MDLSIIIVNWNSAAEVRQCLASVYANTLEIDFEVVVVDSASFDGCDAMLAREFPQARFVQSASNVGFGKANNLGVEAARGACLLFLNPDTEVVGPAVLTMYRTLRSLQGVGCLGCRLLNSDHSLQTSSIQAFPTILNQLFDNDWLRRRFPNARFWGMAPLFAERDAPSRVEAISGACIMTPRAVFEAIGGFSAEYFMYAEDMDLCLKATEAGYTNYYVPTASVIHHGDASVGKARSSFAIVMAVDSLTRYFRKHRGPAYAVTYRVVMTLSAAARLLLLLPAKLARSLRHADGRAAPYSWIKWRAICRWGWGREQWVSQYH